MNKLDLDNAPLMLLVEAYPNESAEGIFLSLSEQYDPRSNDREWGPLYQIGPKFEFEGRIFYQVQTYAGSLMIGVRKKTLLRNILMSNDIDSDFDLKEQSGEHRVIDRSCLNKV